MKCDELEQNKKKNENIKIHFFHFTPRSLHSAPIVDSTPLHHQSSSSSSPSSHHHRIASCWLSPLRCVLGRGLEVFVVDSCEVSYTLDLSPHYPTSSSTFLNKDFISHILQRSNHVFVVTSFGKIFIFKQPSSSSCGGGNHNMISSSTDDGDSYPSATSTIQSIKPPCIVLVSIIELIECLNHPLSTISNSVSDHEKEEEEELIVHCFWRLSDQNAIRTSSHTNNLNIMKSMSEASTLSQKEGNEEDEEEEKDQNRSDGESGDEEIQMLEKSLSNPFMMLIMTHQEIISYDLSIGVSSSLQSINSSSSSSSRPLSTRPNSPSSSSSILTSPSKQQLLPSLVQPLTCHSSIMVLFVFFFVLFDYY